MFFHVSPQELLQLTKVFLVTEAAGDLPFFWRKWDKFELPCEKQKRFVTHTCRICSLQWLQVSPQHPAQRQSMPRFVIPGDPIEVAYGYEDDPGLANVFLSVYDKRLMYSGNASEKVNKVTEKVGDGDGGGSYFALRTGQIGIGLKVDDMTMAVYLKRFGVTDEQIESLPLKVPKPHVASSLARVRAGACPMCQKPGSKRCGKCGSRAYCSDTCQRKEWKIHKLFCALHPFPGKPAGRYVTAMLLPENQKNPRIIHAELQTHSNDGDEFVFPNLKPFLGEDGPRSISSAFLPGQPMGHLTQPIHVHHREGFMVDGSKENACIANLFGALYHGESLGAAHAQLWCGPFVALKSEPLPTLGPMDPNFVDLEMADLHDVLELLRQYGLASMSSHH